MSSRLILLPRQNLAKPYDFGKICGQFLPDPCFQVLVTAAIFFDGSKIPFQFSAEYPNELPTMFGFNWSGSVRGDDFWLHSKDLLKNC